jgi:hypothetical protein
MRKITHVLFTLSLLMSTASSVQAQTAVSAQGDSGPYHVAQTFHIGGAGGWDYLTVDPEHKLLYVPRSTHTMVIDAVTGKTVADIPGQKGNHGVAIVASVGRGFISDGKDSSVWIFDLKTNEILGKVKTNIDSDGIIYDPVSNKVLVVCGNKSSMYTISPDIDPKTGNADPAIDLGGEPEFLFADQGKVYVNLMNKNEVAVVDAKTWKVINRWPTAPGGAPVGMSMDPAHRRLFIGCRNPQKLIVMNADNGDIIADLPIGVSVDAVKFDGDVFASCRDGTLAVARETSPGKFQIVQTVETLPGARTMGLDPTTHSLFLPTVEYGQEKDAQSRPVAKPDSFLILVVRPAGK